MSELEQNILSQAPLGNQAPKCCNVYAVRSDTVIIIITTEPLVSWGLSL